MTIQVAGNVTASIVSHGHGSMVSNLVEDLLSCPEVGRIIVTQNIPENTIPAASDKILLRRNLGQKGYGSNQNAAFATTATPFFCVLNPDIRLKDNPFPKLLQSFEDDKVGLVGPTIVGPNGVEEDSARKFPTLRSLLAKALAGADGTYAGKPKFGLIHPDWLAGMFLLLRADAFEKVGGFDEKYFLYYEDVDLCFRLSKAGHRICQERGIEVIHDARRQSHRNWRFARWHLASMARYLLKSRAL